MEEEALATSSWANLLPDLLGRVIAYLPFPGDRARFRAVCRSWHSAARRHVSQLPWIVLPDCSLCTVGDDGAVFPRISGVPDNATCLRAAADNWLVLDCTASIYRRTSLMARILSGDDAWEPRRDVKAKQMYQLYNPFCGKTVPLPELDAIVSEVVDSFEIRKVLSRSPLSMGDDDDALLAVTTNNWKYPVILCRPGKGSFVLPYLRVFNVAFLGNDRLYGITPDEDLVAFDLADDCNGRPIVTKYKRIIRHPLVDGGEDLWRWMDDDDNISGVSEEDGETEDDSSSGEKEEEEEEEDDFNGDGQVPDGQDNVEDQIIIGGDHARDYITTTRHLVESRTSGDLFLVRHHVITTPCSGSYTRKVELFKADVDAGQWVPVTHDGLPPGEALFLSRSVCSFASAYRDIQDGYVYFATHVDDVFDARSSTCRPFSSPWQRKLSQDLLTWLFQPELVV